MFRLNFGRPSKFGECACSKNYPGFGRPSRFGDCGCSKKYSKFGRPSRKQRKRIKFTKRSLKKLFKLCKIYGIKRGKKSPRVLAKQCLKRVKLRLKQKRSKKRKSSRKPKFGSLASLVLGTSNADDRNQAAQDKLNADKKIAEINQIKAVEAKGKVDNEVALKELELKKYQMDIDREQKRKELELKQKELDIKKKEADNSAKEADRKQKEADKAAKEALKKQQDNNKQQQDHNNNVINHNNAVTAAFGKRRRKF
jgi:hypothetical protein